MSAVSAVTAPAGGVLVECGNRTDTEPTHTVQMGPAATGQGGGIALMTLFASLLCAALAAFVVTAVASLGEAAARARTAADAAALAGAGTSPLVWGQGEDACQAAADLSAANGATLRACRSGLAPGRPGTVVAVTVAVEPRLRVPAMPAHVEARAAATVHPVARARGP